MIIENTVTNTVHEIFNVLEGLSYRDAKAALERVADELENNLFVGNKKAVVKIYLTAAFFISE